MVEPKGKLPITVIVAAKNEERNIERCVSSLSPAASIVVVDSSSSDATEAIARNSGAQVIQFHYTGAYPKKRQWALDNVDIKTAWVFLIDADEVVPRDLWNEIELELTAPRAEAYVVKKEFHFLGRRFRFGGFSHGAILLFKNGAARFESPFDDRDSGLDMEVHERLLVNGPVAALRTPIIHEDFKGLAAYMERHNRYSTWEAELRLSYRRGVKAGSRIAPKVFGNIQERRRFLKLMVMNLPLEPWIWFLYHYIFRLAILEGRRGLIACQIRANYIRQVKAKLYERDLSARE